MSTPVKMQPNDLKELSLDDIPESWGALEILNYEGLAHLKQIAQRLRFQEDEAIKKARALERAGCLMWENLGIRKVWNFWVVNMPLFKKFYFRYFFPYQQVQDKWKPRELFFQDGLFFLDHVCDKLPPQKAALIPRGIGQRESGISEDEQMKCMVIDLERFRTWSNRNKQEDI